MIAQHFTQGLVHQVSGGMVAHRSGTGFLVYLSSHYSSCSKCACFNNPMMSKDICLYFLSIFDFKNTASIFLGFCALNNATITNLTTRFSVERRGIQYDDPLLTLPEGVDERSILIQRYDFGHDAKRFVANKHGWNAVVFQIGSHFELTRRARLLLLTCHGGVKGCGIDGDIALAADVGSEIEWEAIGVVQLEGCLTIENSYA